MLKTNVCYCNTFTVICLVKAIAMATEEEQDNFVKLCGDGDLESVTQLLNQDPSLIKAPKRNRPSKL